MSASNTPILACNRCKAKKLKCDAEPKTCGSCRKAGSECMQFDSRSKRKYPRGYVEELQHRIDVLKRTAQGNSNSLSVTAHTVSTSSLSPKREATYHEVGTFINMARLVEAAVSPVASMPLSDTSPDVQQEHNGSSELLRTTPATLPPEAVAQDLVYSYLNGLHLLHPFMRRSTVLQELETLYANSQSQTNQLSFRINLIFAIGAASLFRSGSHDVPPLNYYAAAMHFHPPGAELPAEEQIQGLLLILMFSLQYDVRVGNKWDLARMAMHICIENGFHQHNGRGLSPMDEQMRRRIFWACYVSDRHSSSVQGRPLALQEEDISVELPIDADDDLIESGNAEAQMLRGMSEVSAQLQQIRLRQITTKIGTSLHRRLFEIPAFDLQTAVNDIEMELSQWRKKFPVLPTPRNPYETTQWRDLNYFRERLYCSRFLVLSTKIREVADYSVVLTTSLNNTVLFSGQIADLYQRLHSAEKLVLNWTCVHDMMSVGFSTLYCAILYRQLAPPSQPIPVDISKTIGTTVAVLQYIAEKWPTVNRHFQTFQTLAERVTKFIQQSQYAENPFRPPQPELEAGQTTTDFDPAMLTAIAGGVDEWDSAMAAFLDEPFDWNTVDWGAVSDLDVAAL